MIENAAGSSAQRRIKPPYLPSCYCASLQQSYGALPGRFWGFLIAPVVGNQLFCEIGSRFDAQPSLRGGVDHTLTCFLLSKTLFLCVCVRFVGIHLCSWVQEPPVLPELHSVLLLAEQTFQRSLPTRLRQLGAESVCTELTVSAVGTSDGLRFPVSPLSAQTGFQRTYTWSRKGLPPS